MRLALVTGASKGLGKYVAEVFSEGGFFVYALARDSYELRTLSSTLN